MAEILTTASAIQCPHGGRALLNTSNTKVQAGAFALIETDIHPVTNCPFTLPGPKPSPCVRIEWSVGAGQVSVEGVSVLTKASVGTCYSAENVTQGVALVVNTQIKASAE